MRHWMSVSISAASFALAVGTTAMWVRSHRTDDERRCVLGTEQRQVYFCVLSHSGSFAFKMSPNLPIDPPGRPTEPDWFWCREYEQWGRLFSDERSSCGAADVRIETGGDELFDPFGSSTIYQGAAVVLPYGVLVALFAVFPARRGFRRARAVYRRCRSRCAKCGYDLRASSARCPECGEPFPKSR